MGWCDRRGARPLRPDAISKENVGVCAGINGAALAVVAVLSLMTWIFWDKRLGAAVVGSTGVVAVLGFVLVAELRWRAEKIAGNAVRLYQLLADHSSDMIVSFDPSTQQRTYVSPSCRRLYGYEPEEALAMAATEIIHPADLPAVEAALENVGESGRGAVRYRGRRKDGNYIWV